MTKRNLTPWWHDRIKQAYDEALEAGYPGLHQVLMGLMCDAGICVKSVREAFSICQEIFGY